MLEYPHWPFHRAFYWKFNLNKSEKTVLTKKQINDLKNYAKELHENGYASFYDLFFK